MAHVVVEMLVLVGDQAELSWRELCEGLPIDEQTLRRRFGGLDWDLAAELFERIEARIGLERLKALSAWVPDVSPITKRLLSRFVRPRLMLPFAFRTFVPTMFPMYEFAIDDTAQPDGSLQLHVVATLKPGFRDCRTLFELHGPATAALPTMSGEPPLAYRAETTGRGGEYWFTIP